MTAPALISHPRGTDSRRPARPAPQRVPRGRSTLAVAVQRPRPLELELEAIAGRWQLAFDAAESALHAAAAALPAAELERRRRDLGWERQQTAESLARLARVVRLSPVPWPVP